MVNFKGFIVILGIIGAISLQYPIIHRFYYLFMLILGCALMLRLLKSQFSLEYVDKRAIFFLVFSFLYLIVTALYNEKKLFITNYLVLYLLVIYLYLCFSDFGIGYAKSAFKHLTIFLNILAIFNIYQILFHQPLLLKYMQLMDKGYGYNFGTSMYRTMSVFGHPIVAGLFFVIAFFCNMYVLKSPIKYLLEILILINIYSTQSRSSWIAFVIVMIVYLFINRGKMAKVNFSLTYRKLLYIFLSGVIICVSVFLAVLHFDEIYFNIANRFGNSLSLNSTDTSNLQRTMTISLIFNAILNSNTFHMLFGYGLGASSSYMLAHPLLIPGFTTTDNQYLEILYDFGIVGLLACLTFLVYLFMKKRTSWIQELSFLCLLIVIIQMVFFEGIGWQNVSIMLTFSFACLTFNFSEGKGR